MRVVSLTSSCLRSCAAFLLFSTCVGSAHAAPVAQSLIEQATAQGSVPVIVGLRLSSLSDATGAPDTVSETARQWRRQAIDDARRRFFHRLSADATGEYEQYNQWDSLPYVAIKASARALQHLQTNPHAVSVQEDKLSRSHLASATEHIGADATWAAGYGGLGWTVVILDTGIDADHPFYGGRVVTEACWSAGAGGVSLCPGGGNSQTGLGSADALTAQCWSTVGDTTTANICDHGSHVAGIAGGQEPLVGGQGYDGVAPEANIIAIQVFSRFNNDADCGGDPGDAPCVSSWDSDQISALDYINDTLRLHWPIAAANMSLGGGMNDTACDGDARKAAVDNLKSNDIATVISSGNDDWTNALGAPGCISTAVTVGNVFDGNPCNTFDEVTDNMHSVVDILASGRCVDSSVPDDNWGNKSGTSMAAPEVTGAFAVLRAIDSGMSVDDILGVLQATGVLVTDTRAPNPPDADAGHTKPRLQLDAAVASLTSSDLLVFKDCKPDDPMLVGDTATCTITVRNLGPDAAISVSAVDEYLSDGTFEFGTVTTTVGSCSTTANPQNNAGTVTCDIGGLGAGESVSISIPVTADTPQNINDLVTVSSITPDPDTANNFAEDEVNVVEMADLEVFKDCKPDEPMHAGETAICTITVRNWGPSTAQDVVLTDAHVSEGEFEFGTVTTTAGLCVSTPNPQVNSGDVDCDLGDLASGAEVTIVVPLTADEAVNINDTAIASSATQDPDNGNNSAFDGVGVDPLADLALTKDASPEPVIAGTQLTYDLEVTNGGPSTAVNVVIEDVLPFGVIIDSVSSPDGGCNAGVPGDALLPTTCTVNSLAPGESATMQIVVSVEPQTLGILGNNASVRSDVFDGNNDNNLATTDTLVEAEADIVVTKSDSPDPVLAGQGLNYSITVENLGPSTAVDVMLVDVLPEEVDFQGYTVSNGTGVCVLLLSDTVECDLNDLNPGEFVTVSIDVLVDPSVPDGTVITDTATGSSIATDPDETNNETSEDTTVLAEADLFITKDASFLVDNPSKQITYSLLVSNGGPSDALDVVVVDTLPLTRKKIVYVMDSGNGACAYDSGSHTVTCDFGTLAAGESVGVDIVVDARGSVRRITNTATVTTSTTDPDASNNTADKEIRVKGGPGRPN